MTCSGNRAASVSAGIAVVMGVSGSGKSTLGAALAERLGRPFCEGDDLHPAANVAKMAAGTPLSDADRAPWLRSVRARIDAWVAAGQSAVITCSALKRSYRDVLRGPEVVFVLIDVPRPELQRRLRARRGHFMPLSLLDSQLATLERPSPDEHAIVLDGTAPPAVQLDRAASALSA